MYARVVAVADAAAGIKTFTFAWPDGAGRTSRPRPFTYQPGMYASFDFQARTVPGGKCRCKYLLRAFCVEGWSKARLLQRCVRCVYSRLRALHKGHQPETNVLYLMVS